MGISGARAHNRKNVECGIVPPPLSLPVYRSLSLCFWLHLPHFPFPSSLSFYALFPLTSSVLSSFITHVIVLIFFCSVSCYAAFACALGVAHDMLITFSLLPPPCP